MNVFIAEVLTKNTSLNKPGLKRFCKIAINDKHKLESVYLMKYKWSKEE